jgi:hypothetical protein
MSMAAKRPLKCEKININIPLNPAFFSWIEGASKPRPPPPPPHVCMLGTVIQDHPSPPASGPSEQ